MLIFYYIFFKFVMQKEIVPFEIKIWLFSFYVTAFFFVILFNVFCDTMK